MKKDLHPSDYRQVVIQDTNADYAFLTRSTAKTDETIKWEDGKEYPLVKVHISSASHPFYTGEEKVLDIEGRVDRFKAKQEAAKKQREKLANKAKKAASKAENKTEPEAQKLGARPTADDQIKKIKSKKSEEKKTEDKKAEAPAEDNKPQEPKTDEA